MLRDELLRRHLRKLPREIQHRHLANSTRLNRCNALVHGHDEPRRLLRRKDRQRMIAESERGIRTLQDRLVSQVDAVEETYSKRSQGEGER